GGRPRSSATVRSPRPGSPAEPRTLILDPRTPTPRLTRAIALDDLAERRRVAVGELHAGPILRRRRRRFRQLERRPGDRAAEPQHEVVARHGDADLLVRPEDRRGGDLPAPPPDA